MARFGAIESKLGGSMGTTEQKALLRLLKDNKDMKEQLDYLVDAIELLVKIETERIKHEK